MSMRTIPSITVIRLTLLFVVPLLICACAPQSQNDGAGAQIHVTTDPVGARITCDTGPSAVAPSTFLRISPGEHTLTAGNPGYEEKQALVTIKAGERVAVDLKLEPIYGLVLIHSTPLQGADVEVDAISRGKTPLLIHDVPIGTHSIKISLPGFVPKTMEMKVADRTPQKIVADLRTDAAQLRLESQPDDAQAALDGAAVGNTPLAIPRVSTGKHTVDITRKGYAPYHAEFSLQAGDDRKISVTLAPLPARMSVISRPEKARIYINEQFKGESPMATDTLTSGTYTVRAELNGYDPQTKTNTVFMGDEITVEFVLMKNNGTLLISTEPPGVGVIIDGESKGATRPRGQELISEQLKIEAIPRGRHTLQLSKTGYLDLTKTFTLLPNQTLIEHQKLRLRPIPFKPNVIVRTGPSAEQTFKGIIRDKYPNGDIKLEVEPGIYQSISASDIKSTEPIPVP